MHKVGRIYSSYTGRSSENLCSISGGAQEKKKDRVKLRKPSKIWWFPEFHPPLNVNVVFCKFFFNLTLCITKLRVLVLSFQNWWFPEFHPPLNANVVFCNFFFKISPCVWPNSGYWCFLFLTLQISLIREKNNNNNRFICKIPQTRTLGPNIGWNWGLNEKSRWKQNTEREKQGPN